MVKYDVAIIGGGPAGSSTAIALAKAGRRVIVLEREKFPRFHIGESLLPFSVGAFERLGLREKMDARFFPKHGGEFATTCGEHRIKFRFRTGFPLPHVCAYQVTRADFDKMLLDHAAESGAEIREETAVDKVDFSPEGVTLTLPGGETIKASYVVDASGRNSLIGTQFGIKKPYAHLQKFSVYAHFENVDRDEGTDGSMTRIIRGEDRWFWMIPLSETKMSIGVVMDTAKFKSLKLSPEAALEAAIAEQPVLTSRMALASRVSQVYSTGDYSYRNTKLSGDRWLLAGDAAGFIDPIFSTGVFLAIDSGEHAAEAVNSALDDPGKRAGAFLRYEKRLNKVMDMYLRFVTAWYTPEFIEVFVRPERRFKIPQAVNSVLAGNVKLSWAVWWRMELFYLIVKLQKKYALLPRLNLTPGEPKQPVEV